MTTYYKYTETEHGNSFRFDGTESFPAFLGAVSLKANPTETVPGPPVDPNAGTVIRTTIVARSPRVNLTDPVSEMAVASDGIYLDSSAVGADDIRTAPGTSLIVANDGVQALAASNGTDTPGSIAAYVNQALLQGQHIIATATSDITLSNTGNPTKVKLDATGTSVTGSLAVSDDLAVADDVTIGGDVAITGNLTVSGTYPGGGGAGTPSGSIVIWPGATAPTGWLLCDGSSLLRVGTYAAIYAVVGTTYGAVDGTHFNLPPLGANVPVGYKSGDANFGTLGGTAGATSNSHTHTSASHAHVLSDAGAAEIMVSSSNYVESRRSATATASWTGGTHATVTGFTTTGSAQTVGAALTGNTNSVTPGATGSAAVSTLQPSITMNYIIKI